jgi:hypothetical protein
MRAFSWLKNLMSSERGNVFVVGAAVMPLLIGSTAFAVDTIQLAVWKRQLQRAADSGAIAGAYALSLGNDEHLAVHRDLEKNEFPVLSQEEGIWVGERLGFNRTVRVLLTAKRTAPFMSIFTNAPSTIIADATAALVDDGTFCLVSLYEGTSEPGIVGHGNGLVDLSCGMKTNSGADGAITATGGIKFKADPAASVGGIKAKDGSFVEGTTFQPFAAKQADPLSYLPEAELPPGCDILPDPDVKEPTELSPGCYEGLTIKDVANMAPGTYYVTGNIDFTAQANLTGKGVTIIMTGQSSDMTVNGGAKLNLSAPNSGDYKGVLFYRRRDADQMTIKFNGGADMTLEGAMYMKSADLEFTGGSGMNVNCLQMVARTFKFSGNTEISNVCPENSGSKAFQQTVVRLVG